MSQDLRLELDDWVPIRVGQEIVDVLEWQRSSATDDEVRAGFPTLRRLATDERMRTVWRELAKRDRDNHHPTNQYRYAAMIRPEVAAEIGIAAHDKDEIQSRAMAALFFSVYCTATFPLIVVRRCGWRPRLLMRLDEAKTFAEIRMELDPQFDIPIADPSQSARFRAAIQHSHLGLWHVILCRQEVALIVNRTIRNARARCVGISAAAAFEDLFGSRMYGLAATVASVALGIDVKLSQVRQWCSEVEPLGTA
ncbi:hypothetical protein [Bradyrhizobium vignae]|uniref:Uncharacterized protein n=1 Tax=Bradyrhizobium vignae TaxID=1549949 RepID=A0ABS3ZTJ1_9BRAD|nr:hypothetical protein [Bradyrhizobium vignae]MBP0111058.1 hypothetical protein [Bradyrhizobium vignae]